MSVPDLPPDFFEFKDVPQFGGRTVASVEKGDPVWSKEVQEFGDLTMYAPAKSPRSYASKALAGNQETSLFTELFFSKANIDEVQRQIRYAVYLATDKKHVIDTQNEEELLIVMRAIYLEYGRVETNPCKIKCAIEKLNNLVLNRVLPNLISHVEQYYGYLRDISNPYTIMTRPSISDNVKGTKTLRSVSDVLVGDERIFGNYSLVDN